jgi:type VI secretion system ImpH/TssG family protein
MAAKDGAAQEHLSFLQQAAVDARRYGLFSLLRRAEARARDRPRIGESRLPEQNIVDLAQTPSMSFPGSTLNTVTVRNGRARVEGYWLGLTGPMGPLPLHLTEFADFERRYAGQQPFGAFLDMIAGRSLQLFYRAWAESSPAASADRPDDDRFAGYVAALTGAAAGVRPDAVFPARARLHYAGVFVSRRSAASIQDAVSDLLGAPATLVEYIPLVREIEPEDQTRLGRGLNQLGLDAVAGRRTYTVTDAFRIVVHARSLRDYEDLLPGRRQFQLVAEALQAFTPNHLEWDLQLEIDAAQLRPAALDGRTRLGWTGWVNPDPDSGRRGDARLGIGARRIARNSNKKDRSR